MLGARLGAEQEIVAAQPAARLLADQVRSLVEGRQTLLELSQPPTRS